MAGVGVFGQELEDLHEAVVGLERGVNAVGGDLVQEFGEVFARFRHQRIAGHFSYHAAGSDRAVRP